MMAEESGFEHGTLLDGAQPDESTGDNGPDLLGKSEGGPLFDLGKKAGLHKKKSKG
jgi:hypothetical protein